MKFALILMVRNEERIIKRCLEAVEGFVDEYCVNDTGSTDRTCEIVEEFLTTRSGHLSKTEWKDFGYNRTQSFLEAQKYIELNYGKEDLKNWYGVLLDGDMVFVPGNLKQQELTESGYNLIQIAGNLEYPNTRLVRLDYPWKCVSVTHEYWAGPTLNIPKSVSYIQDLNDGGCKSDKFERDRRLLEKGLEEEPDNVRYMFYLAQTYMCLGMKREAISMYHKRIDAGGWFEEIWYSHYTIAQLYLDLGERFKFEEWMLRAHAYLPSRAEAMYKLAHYFREQGEHYKAYQYVLKGIHVPLPDNALFVEKNVYEGLFYLEKFRLDYYVKGDKTEGLRSGTQAMLKTHESLNLVMHNFYFYASSPKNAIIKPFEYKKQVFGDDFKVSAVSVLEDVINLRYINYWMENGDYKTPEGRCVQTFNAMFGNDYVPIYHDDLTIPKREFHIKGFEDLRLYKNENQELCFIANTQEYDGAQVYMVRGTYGNTLTNCVLMKSPLGNSCEKNWLPINGTNKMIYNWCPLQIGNVNADQLDIDIVHKTPPLFSLFRGSSSPFVYNNELWTLVHFVQHDKPRKYYHCFVSLDISTYAPKSVSIPFVFQSASVEYCISARLIGETIRCNVTFMDADPSVVEFPVNSLEWIAV
jgi:glycosyltransferase involved in cell wall biosynthesis